MLYFFIVTLCIVVNFSYRAIYWFENCVVYSCKFFNMFMERLFFSRSTCIFIYLCVYNCVYVCIHVFPSAYLLAYLMWYSMHLSEIHTHTHTHIMPKTYTYVHKYVNSFVCILCLDFCRGRTKFTLFHSLPLHYTFWHTVILESCFYCYCNFC